jgi:hypothetical protein
VAPAGGIVQGHTEDGRRYLPGSASPKPKSATFAERWVRSVKQECLSRLILFGEHSLRRTLTEFSLHYHLERNHPIINHQGKSNLLLFPNQRKSPGQIKCSQRIDGLLRYYARAA